tara:strand:+ start:60768 stop:61763 length:996 start_codon:yes stop_codon:yes gene_type:complete
LKCEKGFSIIQVLIASTAIAGLALVGLRLAEDQKKIAIKSSRSFLVGYIKKEMEHLLSSEENCRLSLSGRRPEEGGVDFLAQVFVDKETREVSRSARFNVNTVYNFGAGNIFSILSYKLISKNPYLTEKGFNILQVSFDLGEGVYGQTGLKSEIPIKFKLNDKGFIKSCSVLTNKSVNGPWTVKNNELLIPNAGRVGIGVEQPKAQLDVKGELFIATDSFKPCSSETDGDLVRSGDKLRFCNGEEWQVIGEEFLNFDKPTQYSAQVNAGGTKEVKTKYHNFCSLKRIYISDRFGKCLLKNVITKGERKIYNIIADSRGRTTSVSCEVNCFD